MKIQHYLARQILAKLGIDESTQAQIDLVESLLLTAPMPHELAFHQTLTEREASCLLLAAKGSTMEEVANILKVKFSTIETWHKSIKRKLACRTIAQAVFEGIRYGYM